MQADAALDRIRAALASDAHPSPAPGDRLAAVLAPIVLEPTASLLFTERALELSRHAGEISFPGGLREGDEALEHTALRETNEEIGLDPQLVTVLGTLPPIHTTVSGILVVPFVGVLTEQPALVPNEAEIARVITIPVARLASVEREREIGVADGRSWRGWWYQTDDAMIWGATGAMLHSLLDTLREETTWTTGS